MQTVVETPIFIRRADKLLSESEHFDLITYLATHPTALLIYGKNERADLTPVQRKTVSAFAMAIKTSRKRK